MIQGEKRENFYQCFLQLQQQQGEEVHRQRLAEEKLRQAAMEAEMLRQEAERRRKAEADRRAQEEERQAAMETEKEKDMQTKEELLNQITPPLSAIVDDRFHPEKTKRTHRCDNNTCKKWFKFGSKAHPFGGDYLDNTWGSGVNGPALKAKHRAREANCTWFCYDCLKALNGGQLSDEHKTRAQGFQASRTKRTRIACKYQYCQNEFQIWNSDDAGKQYCPACQAWWQRYRG